MRDRRRDVGDIVRVAKNENGAEVPTVDMKTCVFCELIAGKRPISVIDETEDVLAFMDIQPVNLGHVLIIPKHHAPYLGDLDSTLGGHIFAMGMRVAAALRTCGVRCEGVNLFLADGEAAGQEVFHAHLHVLPRFVGDGFGFKFSPNYFVLPPRAELNDIARGIRNALQPYRAPRKASTDEPAYAGGDRFDNPPSWAIRE